MLERRKIRKVFWVWEYEQEEQWLNQMAQSGWLLDKIGFCTYYFVPCQPGEYIVRLEMHKHDADYLSFMQELDAEYIGRMAQWIYFRRKAELGDFGLFQDIDSKLKHLDKVGKVLAIVGVANLLIGLANTFHPLNIGWINLLCATLVMYCLGRIHGQKETLQKDRLIME